MSQTPPVLITGATGGLGKNTALALARRGYPLLVGGRRRETTEVLCRQISSDHGVEAEPFIADLASLSALRAAMEALGNQPLSAIVTNAGITTREDARSEDGFEITFAVNVLAHQELLLSLADQVVDGGRIVVLSSGVHEPDHKLARRAGIPVPRWVGTRNLALPDQAPDDLRLELGPVRYSTSKLGNVLQARGLQKWLRERERDIDVFAVDPGLMVDTDLAREAPSGARLMFRAVGYLLTPFIGNMRLSTTTAEYLCSMVQDEKWHGRGFQYFDGLDAKDPSPDALRDELVEELWRDSAVLLGRPPPE